MDDAASVVKMSQALFNIQVCSGARLPKVPKLFGRISGDIIFFVSSKRRRFEAWNFAFMLIFIPFTTYESSRLTELAGRSFTNGFSGPESVRDFRETGTCTSSWTCIVTIDVCVDVLRFQTDDPSEYQLWVLSGKVEGAYPLLGKRLFVVFSRTHGYRNVRLVYKLFLFLRSHLY